MATVRLAQRDAVKSSVMVGKGTVQWSSISCIAVWTAGLHGETASLTTRCNNVILYGEETNGVIYSSPMLRSDDL